MASAITHALVGAAIGMAFAAHWPGARSSGADELAIELERAEHRRLLRRLPWYCAALSVSPDADVLMHAFVRYAHPFGHRGAFHSLAFYALLAAVLALHGRRRCLGPRLFACLFLSLASHSLLDMFTNGGLGIGILWPLSTERFFFPWRPIPVSPLSVASFFSEWGLRVLRVELLFAVPIFLAGWLLHRRRAPSRARRT